MPTGVTISLTRWTFVGKVMSLLFNMLSRFGIFTSKKQVSFNFMAAVTIGSDFGAPPPNKVSHSMVGLLVISSKRAYSIPRSAEPKKPCGRPLLTLTSTGITQTLKGRSGWVFVGSPGAHNIFFESSEHLWQVWGLILNTISPLLLSCLGFSFVLGSGVSFFGGIQLSPVDGCSAASCNFGVLAGEDECMSFYFAILFCFFFFFLISLLTKKTLKTKREWLIYINSNVNHITIFAFQSSLLGEILFFSLWNALQKLLHLNIFKNSVWENVRTK